MPGDNARFAAMMIASLACIALAVPSVMWIMGVIAPVSAELAMIGTVLALAGSTALWLWLARKLSAAFGNKEDDAHA